MVRGFYLLRCSHRFFNYLTFKSPAGFSIPRSKLCSNAFANGKADAVNCASEEDQTFVAAVSSDAEHLQASERGDQFGNLKFSLERVGKSTTADFHNHRIRRPTERRRKKFSGKPDEGDHFGNLSDKNSVWMSPLEENPEPGDDSTVFFPERTYRTPDAYLRQMMKLVKERKLKEALELFPDMKEHNICPTHGNYTFMIGACGRAGYTEMAFKLLRQMILRGYRPTPATLTGLFNSCAECPFPTYGLKQAHYLKEKISEKNWPLNQITYHAMIKGFGRCGDLEMAFQIVDEMVAAGVMPSPGTYNFLLMSCISDKEAGFTHSVEVWRKMISKRIPPSIMTFNLLLRAVRDCGVGPEETSSLLLQHWTSYAKRPYGLNEGRNAASPGQMLRLPNPEFAIAIESGSDENQRQLSDISKDKDSRGSEVGASDEARDSLKPIQNTKSFSTVMPLAALNILSKRPQNGPVFFDLLNVKTASDRLALFGNVDGFLDMVKRRAAKPDIKTFTLLLECLPPDTKSEAHLISLMDSRKVRPDTDFFNILIKRRNLRRDYISAKNVLLLLNHYNLCPDIVTFGVLALGCTNRKRGLNLLADMEKLGFSFNIEIIGALIYNACRLWDFAYLEMLLTKMRDTAIHPNEKILTMVEETVTKARQAVLDHEQGKNVEKDFLQPSFYPDYKIFCDFYSEWLQTVPLHQDGHPWDQYKADIVYRGKNESCAN